MYLSIVTIPLSLYHPVATRCNFIQASTHSRHSICPRSMNPVCRPRKSSQPWTCHETIPLSHPTFFPVFTKHRLPPPLLRSKQFDPLPRYVTLPLYRPQNPKKKKKENLESLCLSLSLSFSFSLLSLPLSLLHVRDMSVGGSARTTGAKEAKWRVWLEQLWRNGSARLKVSAEISYPRFLLARPTEISSNDKRENTIALANTVRNG